MCSFQKVTRAAADFSSQITGHPRNHRASVTKANPYIPPYLEPSTYLAYRGFGLKLNLMSSSLKCYLLAVNYFHISFPKWWDLLFSAVSYQAQMQLPVNSGLYHYRVFLHATAS